MGKLFGVGAAVLAAGLILSGCCCQEKCDGKDRAHHPEKAECVESKACPEKAECVEPKDCPAPEAPTAE